MIRNETEAVAWLREHYAGFKLVTYKVVAAQPSGAFLWYAELRGPGGAVHLQSQSGESTRPLATVVLTKRLRDKKEALDSREEIVL